MNANAPTPPLSVLTPVYNNGPFMRRAIDSILDQTFADFEYILVNDGSTDDSQAILEEYAEKDSRIRVVCQENRGYIRALNAGMDMAHGEFIARMDADDIAMPDRFEKQWAYLRDHPECVAVGGRVLLIDEEGLPLREMCQELTHDAIDAAHLAGKGGTIVHPAMMARRNAVIAAGGYREDFPWAEDLDLFLRLAEVGRVANLPDLVLHYRQHLSSIGYSKAALQRQSTIDCIRDAHLRRGLTVPSDLQSTDSTAPTVAESYRKWAWWALSSGYVHSARKHALRALRTEPMSIQSWRVVFCALRGY
ncbi:MAG: hypothetical protein AMXMBFR4_12070 [Candidatus Hydrogenedentota bacterium]